MNERQQKQHQPPAEQERERGSLICWSCICNLTLWAGQKVQIKSKPARAHVRRYVVRSVWMFFREHAFNTQTATTTTTARQLPYGLEIKIDSIAPRHHTPYTVQHQIKQTLHSKLSEPIRAFRFLQSPFNSHSLAPRARASTHTMDGFGTQSQLTEVGVNFSSLPLHGVRAANTRARTRCTHAIRFSCLFASETATPILWSRVRTRNASEMPKKCTHTNRTNRDLLYQL